MKVAPSEKIKTNTDQSLPMGPAITFLKLYAKKNPDSQTMGENNEQNQCSLQNNLQSPRPAGNKNVHGQMDASVAPRCNGLSLSHKQK